MLSVRFRRGRGRSLVATSTLHNSTLHFCPCVVSHVLRYQQHGLGDPESGGQLFGKLNGSVLTFEAATGPYLRDERTRYVYRSNPVAAQKAIARHAALGRTYLGEWHTHADDRPNPSGADLRAIEELQTRSALNDVDLFLLIVGRLAPPDGLRLLSFSSRVETEWTLSWE